MGRNAGRGWLIATIASIMVGFLTVALTVTFAALSRHRMSWGETIKRSERYVTVEGQTLTQDDLAYLASLRNLYRLELTDCDVAECKLPEVSFASDDLMVLDLSGTTGLWSLAFLEGSSVSSLKLSGCPGIDDLAFVTTMEDLSELDVTGTDVDDLTPLADCGQLRYLYAADTRITSLEPLTSLPWLREIDFDGCAIEELSTPFASVFLREVSLADTPVSDLSALADCDRLELLNLNGASNLHDLSWFDHQCCETLTELDLGRSGVAAEDLDWLAACTKLRRLCLDGIALDDLSFCARMAELDELSAVGCGLTTLGDLTRCGELRTLLLGYNHLTSTDGLPAPQSDWAQQMLDLSHNELTTLRDLPRGEYLCLMLQGNDPELGRTVPPKVEAYQVMVDWFSGIDDSRLADYLSFSQIYLLNCPAGKRKTVEETLPSWHMTILTEGELIDLFERDELAYSLFFETGPYVAAVRAQR